jgi:hypothetical protein
VKRLLYKRLAVLEGFLGRCPRRPKNVLFVDNDGYIQGDGSAAIKEWAGKHVSAWPADWFEQSWCITTVNPCSMVLRRAAGRPLHSEIVAGGGLGISASPPRRQNSEGMPP